ncbi:NADPH-dependent F420 reductase [Streptomyces asoensis]|uniref:Dinucleotide-binding protein n=1 Tax=Streptomyces asoensis TaxID=249586 RepID=A0ABQ3S541_9ACTN|nr:NADPH-dependent F420 reductase [Streptomyces asoensis]GGQ65227.1 dinucleotide-binding protein [Streptomyces asoensis]GHI63244.1 dinucleotide-binding protein [Streptomyces asoensis]
MADVSIVGKGNMGQAISGVLTKGGSAVELLGSEDADKPLSGEIVILAVPFPAVDQVLGQRSGQFDGKIVVDISNPLDFETFDRLTVPADSSATAQIAGKLPNARVIKAFNTNFAATLTSGSVGTLETTVLIAGDDTDAKSTLADLVTAGGLKAIDAGSLKRARELEAIGFLQITLAAAEKTPWTGGFGIAG